MPEGILRRVVVIDEIAARQDAPRHVRMVGADAAVDDGDADRRLACRLRHPRLLSADGGERPLLCAQRIVRRGLQRTDEVIRLCLGDDGRLGQRRSSDFGRHLQHHGVERVDLRGDLPTELGDIGGALGRAGIRLEGDHDLAGDGRGGQRRDDLLARRHANRRLQRRGQHQRRPCSAGLRCECRRVGAQRWRLCRRCGGGGRLRGSGCGRLGSRRRRGPVWLPGVSKRWRFSGGQAGRLRRLRQLNARRQRGGLW